ncbi:hypothetical protein G7Y79_00008g024050 [Physcia stellaris]|nr:hypothetical protein G7Y79_00008g024050 [Physcia stellaris]
MVSAIFVASAESIPRLKAKSAPLRDENDQVPTTYVSSFDAIAALIWRSIIKARYPELKEQDSAYSRLRIPVNLRQVLDVPPEYPGNVLLNSVAEMPIKSLTAGSSQRQVALEIRSSLIASRDPSLVRDSIKLSFVLPSLDSRRPLFSDTTGQDLVLTSWLDLSYLKHDWGPMFGSSGNAEFFRVPNGFLRGICALQPRGSKIR